MPDSNHVRRSDLERILRRAAELESSVPDEALTFDEVRAVAAEAGFSSQAVERAISEASLPAPSSPGKASVESGLFAKRISAEILLDVELTPDEMVEVAELFTPYFDQSTRSSYSGRSVRWRDSQRLDVELSTAPGQTRCYVSFTGLVVFTRSWRTKVMRAVQRLERLARHLASESRRREGTIWGR